MDSVVSALARRARRRRKGGYQFRVPKFQPRNPRMSPTRFERSRSTSSEKTPNDCHEIDREMNAVQLLPADPADRGVHACATAIQSKNSKANWEQRHSGLAPTGVAMENWKVGEVHGAEVVQSLEGSRRDPRLHDS